MQRRRDLAPSLEDICHCIEGVGRDRWTALFASKQSPGLRWLKHLEAELILGRVNVTSILYKKDKQINK